MRLVSAAVAAATCVGCGRISFDQVASANADSSDAVQTCASYGPWQPPVHVPELASSVDDSAITTTADQLYAVFERNDGGGTSPPYIELYEASRPDVSASFSMPKPLTMLNTTTLSESNPSLSPDGLTLYYASSDVPPSAAAIMMATRLDRASPFGSPVSLAISVQNSNDVFAPEVSDDGQELIFNRFVGAPQLSNLMRAIWDAGAGQFVSPNSSGFAELTLGGTSAEYIEAWAGLSPDRLTIYFVGKQPANPLFDTYTASRPTTDAPFDPPRMMSEIAAPGFGTGDPELSADGRTLWLGSNRPGGLGGSDIWMSTRTCL